MILGIGGVRALRALGLPIDIYHFNEGHAIFAGFELIKEQMDAGLTFEEARKSINHRQYYNTHSYYSG